MLDQPLFDLADHVLVLGDVGVPHPPKFALSGGFGQIERMLQSEWNKPGVLSPEFDFGRPDHEATCLNGEYSSASQSISPCTARRSSSKNRATGVRKARSAM